MGLFALDEARYLAGMPDLAAPRPPCRVEAREECFTVVDAAGRPVAYVYFADGTRQEATGRWSREAAERIAERIARGFTLAGTRGGSEDAPRKA